MSDPRFARLKTDPRFRRPKKHHSKVVVDERFKGILDEPRTGESKLKKRGGKRHEKPRRVDKFGRQISDAHEKDNLRRFYRLEDEDEEEKDDSPLLPDYARGGVLMESSESEAESQRTEDSDDESDTGGFVTLGRDLGEDGDINLDEDTFADLDAQAAAYAGSVQTGDDGKEAADKTRRLAIVNLDWDHVRAVHLYKIFSSLVSPTAPAIHQASVPIQHKEGQSGRNRKSSKMVVTRGKVLSVRVYPSEFGKERIAREEREGPPVELFKQKKLETEEDINEQTIYETGGGADYDEDALRKYQLERLRYYYAIVECDTVETAVHIYNELEGTELERSANVFDISFVPDEMSFDEICRDEATDEASTQYRPVDFVTDALRHSNVKLTWDDDDPERSHITRRPLTKKEIEEANFKAYIASSSSESDDDADPTSKRGHKSAQRDALRKLLLHGDDDELPEGWGQDGKPGKLDDVDMEITFTPGLTETKKLEDETTMEKYQRKMKEKRKKRKETKVKGATGIEDGEPSVKKVSFDDDFFDNPSSSGSDDVGSGAVKVSKSTRHGSATRDADEPVSRQETKSAALTKKEKRRGKKKKTKTNVDDEDDDVEFAIDVKDDRFKAIHEDHQFAIDPSHPHFKKTKNMTALLDERTKRQRRRGPGDEDTARVVPKNVDDVSLKNLVECVKRKSTAAAQDGLGKRRKL